VGRRFLPHVGLENGSEPDGSDVGEAAGVDHLDARRLRFRQGIHPLRGRLVGEVGVPGPVAVEVPAKLQTGQGILLVARTGCVEDDLVDGRRLCRGDGERGMRRRIVCAVRCRVRTLNDGGSLGLEVEMVDLVSAEPDETGPVVHPVLEESNPRVEVVEPNLVVALGGGDDPVGGIDSEILDRTPREEPVGRHVARGVRIAAQDISSTEHQETAIGHDPEMSPGSEAEVMGLPGELDVPALVQVVARNVVARVVADHVDSSTVGVERENVPGGPAGRGCGIDLVSVRRVEHDDAALVVMTTRIGHQVPS